MAIGIRELRQHASRYIALAKNGERVAVTDRGQLVAYLVPAGSSSDILAKLEASGQYRPASHSIIDLGPPPVKPAGTRPLSVVLEQMREEDRR